MHSHSNKPLLFAASALTAACLVLGAGNAQAQSRMYKCKDTKGNSYYTQTPPPECLGKPTDELNRKTGTVIKHDEGQLTPEQQAQRAAEAKKKQDEDTAAQEQRRRDKALLNTYSSAKDIEDARTRAIRDNDSAITDTNKHVADALKRQKDLNAEKEFYAKKTLPPKLQQDIQQNDVELANQQNLLDVKKKQVADINAKYAADKKRFVELSAPTGATASK